MNVHELYHSAFQLLTVWTPFNLLFEDTLTVLQSVIGGKLCGELLWTFIPSVFMNVHEFGMGHLLF